MRNIFFEKILIIVAVFLVATIGQITLPSMGVFFLGQWPIFVLIFLVSFFENGSFPLAVAFLAGALIDLISGTYFGIFTLSLFSIALIMEMARQRLKFSNPFVFVFAIIFCGLCFWGIRHLLTYVFTII